MSNFTQVDEGERTESLRPIGILALEPGELAERYGLTFVPHEHDGSTAAVLETERGHQYMLLRHLDAPGPGTEVLASELSDNPELDLGELLSALELDSGVVTWWLDREEARASELERQERIAERRVRRWRAR